MDTVNQIREGDVLTIKVIKLNKRISVLCVIHAKCVMQQITTKASQSNISVTYFYAALHIGFGLIFAARKGHNNNTIRIAVNKLKD